MLQNETPHRGSLSKITVKGFKSIHELIDFELKNLNVLVGANGAGKSNFVQLFHMFMKMAQKGFNEYVLRSEGADSFLFKGALEAKTIEIQIDFYSRGFSYNSYRCELTPTPGQQFYLSEYQRFSDHSWRSIGPASIESNLYDNRNESSQIFPNSKGVGYYVYETISNWLVYHFHDTSFNSSVRRPEIREDVNRLRSNGSNLAPLLLHLKNSKQTYYEAIVNAVRLIAPFFDDFILSEMVLGEAVKIKLDWKQRATDYPFQPYHLSDGTLRFICLVTALLQPNLPSTIVIDEPELGLHPGAIHLLGELIISASKRTQVVITTQSPLLLDQFGIEDIIVVNRKLGQSTFERLDEDDYKVWLEEYSVGQLWTKNIIDGGAKIE